MFSWDIRKAISNFDKHGVPFEEAATVFGDPEGLAAIQTAWQFSGRQDSAGGVYVKEDRRWQGNGPDHRRTAGESEGAPSIFQISGLTFLIFQQLMRSSNGFGESDDRQAAPRSN
jgi:hypothetical protein